jgi:hypothetical protein
MRIFMFLLSIASLHVSWLLAADDSRLPLATDNSRVEATDNSEHSNGGVILDGRYIAPPYHIVAVADGIELNGHFVPEAGFNERSRRNRDSQSRAPFAERVRSRLEEGAWLLGWEEGEYGILNESRISDVLYVLSNESTRNGKIDELELLGLPWIGRVDWRQLVDRCELPVSVLDQYRSTFDAALSADPVLAAAIGAPLRRFHMSIYLLTVLGMGATVFALGTLLSYRPVEKMPWSCVNLSKDATQLVLRSVILLIGLAVLDLVCTTISAQTASFWELNPFGAAVLSTPLVLGTFKIGATLMSGSILLLLRRYHGAQVASWWLALFCTILAIRWVTFNSMFMA